MLRAMKIDFVSDIVCPWCAIGMASLQTALARFDGQVQAELHIQPFELNPQMAPEGEELVQHLSAKYGITPAQIAENRKHIEARGAAVGFNFGPRERTYNTFDAHRLLHWAGLEGQQIALKQALLQAYHGEGLDVSQHAVLEQLATDVGLDGRRAHDVLASGAYADEVRERERFYQERGITGVPAVIFDDRYLVSGGQPPEAFERALRQVLQDTGDMAA
jgi:predicted DsbA family dithiol-disulfide isomerase